MIKPTQGDMLEPDDVDAIVNTAKGIGVMDKDITLQPDLPEQVQTIE